MADRLSLRPTDSQASGLGGTQYRNSLSFVASEHPEIPFVYSDHCIASVALNVAMRPVL
jgi:hypothetical protein